MTKGPICIACENGEHGTIINDLAGHIMKCDCACHHRIINYPADPLLPKSRTQSTKALLHETRLPNSSEPWWYRALIKVEGIFTPGKERA